MAQEVSRYGIHVGAGRLAYLHQSRGGLNAVGMRENSPFVVKTRRRWNCNHMIALNAVNPAKQHMTMLENMIQKDSLVRFMLPLPKEADRDTKSGTGVLYTTNIDDDLLVIAMLTKMSSPVKMPIFWVNLTTAKAILDELEMTNVQPLVLAGVEPRHTQMIMDIVRAAATLPRRLLILSHPHVPIKGATELKGDFIYSSDEVDLTVLPWEALGATIVRAYMRLEWDGSWFTREPVPGNEHKDWTHGQLPPPPTPTPSPGEAGTTS